MFRKLEGDYAVLMRKGVYTPSDIYAYNGGLFVRVAGGYARVRYDGTTSKDGVMLLDLATDLPLYADRFGRVAVEPGEGRRPVTAQRDAESVRLVEDQTKGRLG